MLPFAMPLQRAHTFDNTRDEAWAALMAMRREAQLAAHERWKEGLILAGFYLALGLGLFVPVARYITSRARPRRRLRVTVRRRQV